MIALMPFFVQHFGAPPLVVGLTFTVFAVCQFIAGPFWGHLSDRTGRKRVLIISQVGATISWLMLAFAPNLAIVFIARALEGTSGGNLSITHAYVADLTKPEQRARAFAYVGASFSAGMVFGPAIGGLLFARFGYTAPFLAAALLQLVTLAVTICYLPESRSKSDKEEPANALAAIVPTLHDPVIAPLLWQRLCYSLGLYGWFSVFTLVLAAQLHFDAARVSYLFAVFGIVSVILELGIVGRIAERIGDRNAASLGLSACLITFALAPFVHDLVTALVMLVMFACGLAIADATLPSMLSAVAPENRRGTILGVGSSLESLSGVVMPPLSTGILQLSGVPATAALSGVLVTAAFIIGALRKHTPVAKASLL